MILHTLNASPSSPAFVDCLAVIAAGDTLLLLGDGVYAALKGSDGCAQLEACGASLHVLQSDAEAAGILQRMGSFKVIDMTGFVALSERCPRQQAWY